MYKSYQNIRAIQDVRSVRDILVLHVSNFVSQHSLYRNTPNTNKQAVKVEAQRAEAKKKELGAQMTLLGLEVLSQIFL